MSGNKQQVTSSSTSSTTTAAPATMSGGSSQASLGQGVVDSKSAAAYESLFDSGYSATAMSLNSSSDVHQSTVRQPQPDVKIGKGVAEADPSGDSGLCIDSGLSIDCSSPDMERTSISFPQQHQPLIPGLKQSGQSQQVIRLQSSSTTLPLPSAAAGQSNYTIDSNYECFINNSYGQDDEGDTLLHLAIIKGSPRLAIEIINLAPHPDFLDIRNHLYQTPLIMAALTGQTSIAHRLILAGATIDKRDMFGSTILHIACKKGDIDMVSTIITPLTDTEVREHGRRSKYQPVTSPGIDTESWNSKILSMIHAMDYEGQTCIHMAAKSGNKKLIELLMKIGADVNVKEGKSGWTILHWAICNEKIDLVQFLIHSCHANVNALSYAGHSCLQLANSLYSSSQSVRPLINNPLSFNPSPSNQPSSNHDSARVVNNIISLLTGAGATSIPSNTSSPSSSDSEYSDEE